MTQAAAFQQSFKQFIAFCTEDYLIRHANKGLYNRAVKDIDKGMDASYIFGDSSVECTLGDGTQCTLGAELESASCSCPADTMCKHILIAILFFAKEHASPSNDVGHEAPKTGAWPIDSASAGSQPGSASAEEPAKSAGSLPSDASAEGQKSRLDAFRWMLAEDLAPLLASFSAALIQEALFRLQYAEEISVITDSLLTVSLNSQGIEVSFKENGNPAKALCKTKGRPGDLARLEALLRYRAMNGLDDSQTLGDKAFEPKFSRETVAECRALLGEMLAVGLARLPHFFAARLETLAVAARSGDLPDIERGLRGIQGELELFFNRHVRFSMNAMLDRITGLILRLNLLEQENAQSRQKAQLVGTFRSAYYAVPQLRLYGLGAEPWETRSGYRGLTYYLFGLDDGKIYTYSDARAVFYEGQSFSFQQRYEAFSPWLPHLTMKAFSESEMVFGSAKLNMERRLSSSESARLVLEKRQPVEELQLGDLLREPAMLRHEGEMAPALFGHPHEHLVFIHVTSITGSQFNKHSQKLELYAQAGNGEAVLLTLAYHSEQAKAFKLLESAGWQSRQTDFYVFARVTNEEINPISLLKKTAVASVRLLQ
ncbi:hypothetical protein ACX93W_14175 [Paenibacillus sp. CAU 1782]